MKKLFFAICFITLFGPNAEAAITQMHDEIELHQHEADQNMKMRQPAPLKGVPADYESFRNFIRERSKIVAQTPLSVVQNASTMNAQGDVEFIAKQKQNKSTFEQIYEEAMERLNLLENNKPADLINTPALLPEAIEQKQNEQQNTPKQTPENEIDVVSITLPTGQTVLAPAKEHIPYLTSKIEILPNGIVHIKETVNLIANGIKLKYGLSKALPKYSISRTGVKNATIPYLNSVKINGTDVPYQLKDAGDRYLIVPKDKLPLQPGVYTYEFDYMLDRKLWYYDDRNEFYWDVTGSFWNLAISQAIATVRLPIDVNPLGQNMFIGYAPNYLTDIYSTITKDKATNALGFTSTMPLYAGEGMHILISIPKKGFLEPDFNKKFEWFIEDYGDIIFSLFGLIAIVIAYIISWRYINSGNDNMKAELQKTPAMLRMLINGTFDKVSFGSFLLDLFRRNIIDLKAEDDTLQIIKKTDNLSRLNKFEKKALQQIIGPKEFSVSIDRTNALKLKRAYKIIEKDTFKRIRLLTLKLNAGYIFFSCAMLALSELAMAWLNVNTPETFGVLISTTLTLAFYVWVLKTKFKNKFIGIIAKIFAVILIILAVMIMCLHIHFVSALFIAAMVLAIFTYTNLFATRKGLLKNNIKDALAFKQNLVDNARTVVLGGQFKIQQANIYALNAQQSYPKSFDIAKDYRLDVMPLVHNLL